MITIGENEGGISHVLNAAYLPWKKRILIIEKGHFCV